MAARTSPTERQKRLGAEVRKLRTAAGMSAERAAGLLGIDRSNLSSIEKGVRAISPERVRTLACNCECSDAKYVDALAEMAGPSKRGWWERYRGALPAGLLDIAEVEWHAKHLRSADFLHMPGLLQTSDHAVVVFRSAVPSMPDHEVALRVAHRMERAQILDGDDAKPYVVLLHEAVLRMRFGGRRVTRSQLEHLLVASERDNVTLRVVPFEAGAFPGAGVTMFYAEGPVPGLGTVQVDSAHGPEFLDQEAQLSKYKGQLDWLERLALSPKDTRDFVRTVANEL